MVRHTGTQVQIFSFNEGVKIGSPPSELAEYFHGGDTLGAFWQGEWTFELTREASLEAIHRATRDGDGH